MNTNTQPMVKLPANIDDLLKSLAAAYEKNNEASTNLEEAYRVQHRTYDTVYLSDAVGQSAMDWASEKLSEASEASEEKETAFFKAAEALAEAYLALAIPF